MEIESLASEMLSELKLDIKRSHRINIILIILLFLTNVGYILFISQYEYSTETTDTYISTDNQGNDNDGSIEIKGDVINGNN